jgi:DNA-binding response OmpR family regulator
MTRTTRILIVDDDARLCRSLRHYFQAEGYDARVATSGQQMRNALASERPDLVILDLILPDEDGFSLARELRVSYSLPIVILTGKTDTIDKVVGLEIGADDYVTKPFEQRELLARVRSVLRRASDEKRATGAAAASVACFAGWRFDLDAHELTAADGRSVTLSKHEFQLLEALVRHGNRVLTRDAILELVAGREWSPEDRSVDVLVGKLRRKIDTDTAAPSLIKTVRGVGYRLATPVLFR